MFSNVIGSAVHDELTTKANCEMLRELAKTTQHENVRQKVLELIQAWTFAFRKSTKYRNLKVYKSLFKYILIRMLTSNSCFI